MTKLDEFKLFVRKNPKLINHVKNGKMTWQNFYEIYDLYGEDSNAWKEYIEGAATVSAAASTNFLNFLKNIDLDSVQNGVNNIQRVVGVLQDLSGKDTSNVKTSEYKPRPIYKSFDD